MPKYNHKGLDLEIIIRDDLLHTDVEAFSRAIREHSKESANEYAGAVVRAAHAAGWFDEATTKRIEPEKLRHNQVIWLATKINEHDRELKTIPPN